VNARLPVRSGAGPKSFGSPLLAQNLDLSNLRDPTAFKVLEECLAELAKHD